MKLSGIAAQEGQKLLREQGIFGSEETLTRLVTLYAGNPLALYLVAESIRDVFLGDVNVFLKEEELITGDIHHLMQRQFGRLSGIEQEIMYWLMIEQEAVSLEQIREDLVYRLPKREILEALESLRKRTMIESTDTHSFKLQPMILEYIRGTFIEHVFHEFVARQPQLLRSHALIQAQAKEYLRENQERVILTPLIKRLLYEQGQKGIEQTCISLLTKERHTSPPPSIYTAGNILNLLLQLSRDLRGYDVSCLPVRQAFFRNATLQKVNFAQSHFSQSVFTDTFGGILSLHFHPNGTLLASGGTDQTIRLWDTATRQCLSTLRGHTNRVMFVAFNADGMLLASGSDDQTIRLWDVTTGQCLYTLYTESNRVRAVAFSTDGQFLASGSDDRCIRLWSVNTKHCLFILSGHTDRVLSVTFSPNSLLLASSSADHTIRLWDVPTGTCLSVLTGHSHRIRSIAFNSSGTILASGSDDESIKLWDVSSGRCLSTLYGHSRWIMSVAFNNQGMLASASKDQTIRLWDVETLQCVRVLSGHSNRVMSVAFAANGVILASGSEDQTIRLWDIGTGYCLATVYGRNSRIMSVAFGPYENLLASGSDDQTARVWNSRTGQLLATLRGHSNWVNTVIFCRDGTFLATGSEDQSIRVWHVGIWQYAFILHLHTRSGVRSIACSSDGTFLASGSDDQTIEVWNIRSNQHQASLHGHTGRVLSVAFNKANTLLASSSEDHTIMLWDAHTWQHLFTLSGHSNRVTSVAFSADGHLLASGSADQTVKIWAVDTQQCLTTLRGHCNRVKSVAFGPTEYLLASGSDDQTIRIWDGNMCEFLFGLEGHQSSIRSVAFSPDGHLLASGSDDGTLKLWEISTRTCLHTLRSDRPYEQMNITQASGLSEEQKRTLKDLGAIDMEEQVISSQSINTTLIKRDQVFISYSHKDRRWLERLRTVLAPLVRQESIKVWADISIQPGANWQKELAHALSSAKVAVLLVTPNFLASDFIAKQELPPLLKAAEKEGLIILWVAVSTSLYDVTEIEPFQAINDPLRPLDLLSPPERNRVLTEIARKIKQSIDPNGLG